MSRDTNSARGRVEQLAKGIAATFAIATLVGGTPYLLCRFVGWPLPRRVPTWHGVVTSLSQRGISDTTLIDVLAVALWLCWAVLVLAFVAEGAGLVRYRSATRLPIAGRLQPLAGALLSTAVLTFAALTARSGGSGSALPRSAITMPVRPPVPASGLRIELTAAVTNGTLAAEHTNGAATNGTAARAVATSTYTVREGDTLWGIAERELGDATRWKEIFDLNRGVPQPGGGALEHPHWIYAGWVLKLPAALPTPLSEHAGMPSAAPAAAPSSTTVGPSPITPAAPTGPVGHGASTAPDRGEPMTRPSGRPQGAQGPIQGETGAPHHPTAGQGTAPAERPVELSSGDRVGGALVLAVIGALVALRLRRRQRYRPRDPRPGRHLDRPAHTRALADLVALRAASRDDDAPMVTEARHEPAPLTGIPSSEAFALPDRIEVGTHGEGEASIELSLSEWSGLVLSGPLAEDVLRSWCATLLTRNGPNFVEVVTTAPIALRLFGGADFSRSITTCADLDSVMARVDAELVSRARILEEHDAPDAASYRVRDDGEPFPFLVAIAEDVPPARVGHWKAITGSAGRLGATAIALSGALSEDAVHLAAESEGMACDVRPDALRSLLEDVRLFHIGSEGAADLLAPIAAVHNYAGPESEALPEDRAPEDRIADESVPAAAAPSLAAVATALGVVHDETASEWPDPQPLTEAHALDGAEYSPPVRVDVLGPLRVEAFGVPVTKGLRRTAVELLAWYLLRSEGARSASAEAALWPEANERRGHQHFWTALGNLRSRLGRPEGSEEDPLEIVAGNGDRYVPDGAVIECDLWRFEHALRDAAEATEREGVIAALDRALASYGGDFLEGSDDPWSEPAREDLHRRSLDAAFRLASLHEEAGQTDAAIAALRRAISIDPICEEATRRLGRLLASCGRIDEALAARDELHAHLDAADLDSSHETNALFSELRRRQHYLRARAPRADDGGDTR